MSPARRRAILLAILALGALAGAGAARHWSATFDEPQHLEMGRRIVELGDFSRFDNSKMPVSAINALPWVALREADPGLRLWAARLPQLGWLIGCALITWRWARRERGGAAAGLAAAALVAWDPNLVAHSSLVTTDLPATFFVLASCWTLLRLLEAGSIRRAALAGACLGLAQAAKFTCAFLLPIELLITAGWCLARRSLRPLRWAPIVALTAWLGLNGAYGFQGSFTPAADIQWRSELARPLADSALPLPFPRPWLEGLDWVKSDDDQGHGNIYVDGALSPYGRWDYYLRAGGWKLPLPLLLLATAGLIARRPRADDLALLVPIGFLLGWFSLAFNFQLGLRYILPVLPPLALLAARLPPKIVAAGALYTLISHLSWWPWTLSYFNERLGDRRQAWRHLADSNLDWGQGGYAVTAWRERHPGGRVDPELPGPGPMLISANVLTGVLGDPLRYACLREHLPPTAQLAYAHYPYDLRPADFAACYPELVLDPGGGDHLVLLWSRGRASLELAGRRWSAEGGGEHLIGVVLTGALPADLRVGGDGPWRRLFVDGLEREIQGGAGGG